MSAESLSSSIKKEEVDQENMINQLKKLTQGYIIESSILEREFEELSNMVERMEVENEGEEDPLEEIPLDDSFEDEDLMEEENIAE